MKSIITGGAGFIGSRLVQRLLNDGIEVHVLDMLPLEKALRLRDIKDHKNFYYTLGDLRDHLNNRPSGGIIFTTKGYESLINGKEIKITSPVSNPVTDKIANDIIQRHLKKINKTNNNAIQTDNPIATPNPPITKKPLTIPNVAVR